jgi:hypothetical protein
MTRCAATWNATADALKRLEISGTLAEIYADCVDWHQIARLVQHGCPRSSACPSSADVGCEDPAR